MLPAEDALPVAVDYGWPEPFPGSRVILREAGITLGSIDLNDDEWTTVAWSPVYSVRIDDHPAVDGWTATEPDGNRTHHEFEISTRPELVPTTALLSRASLTEWVWSTHGALGRLLLWDERRRWWIVQDADLELVLLCSEPGLFRGDSEELSWWSLGSLYDFGVIAQGCVLVSDS